MTAATLSALRTIVEAMREGAVDAATRHPSGYNDNRVFGGYHDGRAHALAEVLGVLDKLS